MSSSSSSVYNKKYDVFISFRGSDVRQGFLSHLHKALLDQHIEAFVDEQLERGKEISESLLEKIEESDIAIVIFSKDYAYSEWCLEELLKIEECRNRSGQIVIPVFYGVDPSHVQDLTGNYGHAMAGHRTKFDESLVEKWGNVLKDIASLSGLVSLNFNNESLLIDEIIKQALELLNCLYPSDSDCDDGLVGIESRVEKVMSLLCGSENVCVVGIWGEGGIGKTTVASATFDRICSQFDSQCFIGNVREKSEKYTTDAVLNEVVSKLFGTSDCNMSRKRLSRKKVILVLDDVSDLDQIKLVMRCIADVGRGSRIIVTSRDSHVLKNLGAKIYEVEKLDDREALQLFCLNAFKKKVPREGYLALSKRVVKYAQGLALAVKVLGSNLFERCAEEWEDELEKLSAISDKKIQKILRISYEGLCDVEKEMFLDIACCFKGRERNEVESMLDVRGSRIGISRLAEKALISISCGCIQMHDLIQQMGKDIICEEKTPGKRRWLWDPEEIYFLLTRETGTEAVRGMTLNMSKIKSINLKDTAFRKLYNLRYLNFYVPRHGKSRLCVPEGLEYLPEQLRYLHWDQYPFKSLPAISFCAEKIIALTMRDSHLEELWNGVQDLPKLRKIDLSGGTKLIKVPDLSTASNLTFLNFNSCESLVDIPSLKHSSKPKQLELRKCSRLQSLPDDVCDLKSLWFLNISYCKSLYRLPRYLGNLQSLTHLHGNESGVKELPSSINNLRGLRVLSFARCKGLILPPLTGIPNIWLIDLSDCGLSEFPVGHCSMTFLLTLNLCGNNFESIPESIGHLLMLRELSLSKCKKLKCLPESIKSLPRLLTMDLTGCTSLGQNSQSVDHLTAAFVEESRLRNRKWFIFPGSEIPKMMKYKNESGSSLSFSFKLLQDVDGGVLLFYVCVVLDIPHGYLVIKGNLVDELGLKFSAKERQSLPIPKSSTGGDRSSNVALCQICFPSKNFVKGRKYTAKIVFQSSSHVLFWSFTDFSSGYGVSKCGVLPAFDHETIE